MSRVIQRRGGVAAGETSNNPTATSYDPLPPKSTYTGPTVGGSKGGFIGLILGLFIFVCIVAGAWFLYTRYKRRSGSSNFIFSSSPNPSSSNTKRNSTSRGWRRASDDNETPFDSRDNEVDDAFSMPTYYGGRDGSRGDLVTDDERDFRGDIERGGYESPELERGSAAPYGDDDEGGERREKKKYLNPSTLSLNDIQDSTNGGGEHEYEGVHGHDSHENPFRDGAS